MSLLTECPPWTAPAFQRSLVNRLPAGVGGESSVLSAQGHWCNYDIFVSAPGAWLFTTLELRVRNFETVEILDRKVLVDAQLPFAGDAVGPIAPGTTPATVNGLLFSIRGRPCTEFALYAKHGAEVLPQAKFYARAWGSETGVYGDRAGRLPVDPFAGAHQQVIADLLVNTPGPHTLSWRGQIGAPFTTAPGGGRIHITSLLHSTADAGRRVVSLENVQNLTATTVLFARWNMRDDVILSKDWTYPLRGQRAGAWRVGITGAAADHALSFAGFIE
jgi:hypothetical protein